MKDLELTIPALHSAVTKLVSIAHDDEQYFEEVLKTVSQDAMLTGQAFRMAHSSLFAGTSKVKDLEKALMRIGARRFVSECFSSNFVAVMVPTAPGFQWLLQHSVMVAAANRLFCQEWRSLKLHPEWAFVLGMLHNVGSLVLALNHPEAYQELLLDQPLDSPRFLEREEELFGQNHTAVGAAVAGNWSLPTEALEVISFHHARSLPQHLHSSTACRLTQLSIAFGGQVSRGRSSGSTLVSLKAIPKSLEGLGIRLENPNQQGVLASQIHRLTEEGSQTLFERKLT